MSGSRTRLLHFISQESEIEKQTRLLHFISQESEIEKKIEDFEKKFHHTLDFISKYSLEDKLTDPMLRSYQHLIKEKLIIEYFAIQKKLDTASDSKETTKAETDAIYQEVLDFDKSLEETIQHAQKFHKQVYELNPSAPEVKEAKKYEEADQEYKNALAYTHKKNLMDEYKPWKRKGSTHDKQFEDLEKKERALYRSAAEKGHWEALNKYADLHHDIRIKNAPNQCSTPDEKLEWRTQQINEYQQQKIELLRRAAINGHARSQFNLGKEIREIDPEESKKWIDEAIQQEDPEALKYMAKLQSDNRKQSFLFYMRAAAAENYRDASVAHKIAECYYYERGVEVDEKSIEAKKWYHLAAEMTTDGAIVAKLARLYYLDGRHKFGMDLEQSIHWYCKAIQCNHERSTESLLSDVLPLYNKSPFRSDRMIFQAGATVILYNNPRDIQGLDIDPFVDVADRNPDLFSFLISKKNTIKQKIILGSLPSDSRAQIEDRLAYYPTNLDLQLQNCLAPKGIIEDIRNMISRKSHKSNPTLAAKGYLINYLNAVQDFITLAEKEQAKAEGKAVPFLSSAEKSVIKDIQKKLRGIRERFEKGNSTREIETYDLYREYLNEALAIVNHQLNLLPNMDSRFLEKPSIIKLNLEYAQNVLPITYRNTSPAPIPHRVSSNASRLSLFSPSYSSLSRSWQVLKLREQIRKSEAVKGCFR